MRSVGRSQRMTTLGHCGINANRSASEYDRFSVTAADRIRKSDEAGASLHRMGTHSLGRRACVSVRAKSTERCAYASCCRLGKALRTLQCSEYSIWPDCTTLRVEPIGSACTSVVMHEALPSTCTSVVMHEALPCGRCNQNVCFVLHRALRSTARAQGRAFPYRSPS